MEKVKTTGILLKLAWKSTGNLFGWICSIVLPASMQLCTVLTHFNCKKKKKLMQSVPGWCIHKSVRIANQWYQLNRTSQYLWMEIIWNWTCYEKIREIPHSPVINCYCHERRLNNTFVLLSCRSRQREWLHAMGVSVRLSVAKLQKCDFLKN